MKRSLARFLVAYRRNAPLCSSTNSTGSFVWDQRLAKAPPAAYRSRRRLHNHNVTRRRFATLSLPPPPFETLEQSSRQLLQSTSVEGAQAQDSDMEALIEQWHDFLVQGGDSNQKQQAVDRMEDLFQLYKDTTPTTPRVFDMLLDANTIVPDGARALAILEAWIPQFEGHMEYAPGIDEYHKVLVAFSKAASMDSIDLGAHVAREILLNLQDSYIMNPTQTTYRLVSTCMGRALDASAREVVDSTLTEDDKKALLEALESAMNGLVKHMPSPSASFALEDLEAVCVGLSGVVHSNGEPATDRRHEWAECLYNMLESTTTGREPVEPSDELVDSLSRAMTAVLRLCSGVSDTQRAETIADSLVRAVDASPAFADSLLPTAHHYHLALKLLSKDTTRHTTSRKRYLVTRMEQRHNRLMQERSFLEPQQVTESYNRLMMAHYDVGSTVRVQRIWREMSSAGEVRRDNLSFAVILKALARKGTFKAAQQAHGIWKRMVSKEPDERYVTLNAQHYGSVMVAWSKSRHPQAGKYCREVFDKLQEEAKQDPSLTPSILHHSALITSMGWQKQDSGSLVEDILNAVKDLEESGCEPDLVSFVSVLTALARTRSKEGAERAEALLDQSETLSKDGKPDRKCYISVMHAWARSSAAEAPQKCLALLARLEQAYVDSGNDPLLRPSSLAYRLTVDAWNRSSPQESGLRADELLDQMMSAASKGLADDPDTLLFSSVMVAHSKSGHPDSIHRIELVLERMKQSYATGNVSAKPNAKVMTILLRAYARSNVPDKATITWGILQHMCDSYKQGDLDMRPTAHSFVEVINACAFTECVDGALRDEAVKIALTAMNQLDEGLYDQPNEYTFHNLLQVVGRQIDDASERTRLASVIFHRCCQEGFVNSWILKEIRGNIPELYEKIPLDANKQPNIPGEWSRRVGAG